MSDFRRLEELKRRVQQDPASIAFAALADEYRRAGLFHDAIETCRAGLLRHPAYLSARVTLGRALVEIGEYDEAQAELEQVLKAAPDNLAAIRALAEIHGRRADASQSAMAAPPAEPVSPPVVAAPTPAPVVPLPVRQEAAPLEIVRHEFTSAPAPAARPMLAPAATPPPAVPPPPDATPSAPLVVDPVCERLEEFLAAIERARSPENTPTV